VGRILAWALQQNPSSFAEDKAYLAIMTMAAKKTITNTSGGQTVIHILFVIRKLERALAVLLR
jgi:hypothetical protein